MEFVTSKFVRDIHQPIITKTKGRDTRYDKSLRHIAATSRLVCTDTATRLLALSLSLRSIAQIQTGLNSCDRSQRQNSVAATMIFTCHTRRFVTVSKLSRRRVAAICRIVCLGLKNWYKCVQKVSAHDRY